MLYRYLFVAHFLLVNVVALGFLGAAYIQGWLAPIIDAPLLELTGVICAVFIYGMALAAWKVWQTSRQTIEVEGGQPRPGTPAYKYSEALASGDERQIDRAVEALRLTLSNRIVVVRHIANALVLLGLIGTVIGFIISLSGVDPTAASDANKVGAMVATLISGMSVALNTTLVGSILYVWLIVNHRILATGTVRLLTTVLHMPGTDADVVSTAGRREAAD
ncbi:MAG: MotA/TolQ/ExbB proton channel family protein [Rhodospirillales bacterium]